MTYRVSNWLWLFTKSFKKKKVYKTAPPPHLFTKGRIDVSHPSVTFNKQAFDSIVGNTVVPYRSLFSYHKLLFCHL